MAKIGFVGSGTAGHVGSEMLIRRTLTEINGMFAKEDYSADSFIDLILKVQAPSVCTFCFISCYIIKEIYAIQYYPEAKERLS